MSEKLKISGSNKSNFETFGNRENNNSSKMTIKS